MLLPTACYDLMSGVGAKGDSTPPSLLPVQLGSGLRTRPRGQQAGRPT